MLKQLSDLKVSPEINRYLVLVMTQLNIMQCFVEDLLDLKLLCEGTFKLTMAQFNPLSVVQAVHRTFEQQAKGKNIKLSYQKCHSLKLPSLTLNDDDIDLNDIDLISGVNRGGIDSSDFPLLVGDERRLK